jgi:hypothetical protein
MRAVSAPQLDCKQLHLQEVNRPESWNYYSTRKPLWRSPDVVWRCGCFVAGLYGGTAGSAKARNTAIPVFWPVFHTGTGSIPANWPCFRPCNRPNVAPDADFSRRAGTRCTKSGHGPVRELQSIDSKGDKSTPFSLTPIMGGVQTQSFFDNF